MGVFGTDYSMRPAYLLFLILSITSIILGLSYLREMNQRIQFQQDVAVMERRTQHNIVERSNIQRKATVLQTQLENTNKELKSFKDMKELQTEQLKENFESEKNDLLQTISLKDDKIIELQNQYESLKQQFEHLSSVMGQFERNQSRLLEKFSTQSTQCMNVINMISELCKKGKNKFTREDSTLNIGVTVQAFTATKRTENFSLPHPEAAVKGNNKSGLEHLLAFQNTDDNERSFIDIQDLQALGYESTNATGIGDDEAEDTAQEKLYSLGKEKTLTIPKAVSPDEESIAAINRTKKMNVTFQTLETSILKSDSKPRSVAVIQDVQTLSHEVKNTTSQADEEENDAALEKRYSLEGKTALKSQKRKTPQEGENDDVASQKSISNLNKTKYTIARQTSEALAILSDDKQYKQGTEDDQEGDTEEEKIFSTGDDKARTSQKKEPREDGNDYKTSETPPVKVASHVTNSSTAEKQTKMKLKTNTEGLKYMTLETDKNNNSKDGKGYFKNFSESEVNALKTGSLPLTTKDIQATNGNIFVKEDVANDIKTNITLSTDKNLKEEIRVKTLKVKLKHQKWPLVEIKPSAKDVYKTQEKLISENIWGGNDKENEDFVLK